MIKPLPEHFGLNEEDIKTLEKKLEGIKAQFNPTTKGYSNVFAFIATTIICVSYFFVPSTINQTVFSPIGFLLFIYLLSLVFIKLSALIIQDVFSKYNQRVFPVLNKFYNAPKFNNFYHFREKRAEYEIWFNNKKLEFQDELEKWKQHKRRDGQNFWLHLTTEELEITLEKVF